MLRLHHTNGMKMLRGTLWVPLVMVCHLTAVTTTALAQEPIRRERVGVEFETGWLFPGYADVRIPGDGGSNYSLTNDLSAQSRPFVRGRAAVRITERNTLLLLAAPLTFQSSGTVDRPIVFEGKTFRAGAPLESTFTFNSYRLTWRYSIVQSGKFELAVGVTGKIRDAAIGLRGGGESATKTNVGFVPLVSFRASWWFAEPFGLVIDGDALAAPQGRAEDILTALQVRVASPLVVYGGYRFLEGGADNDQVYNFNLIHYAAIGAMAWY